MSGYTPLPTRPVPVATPPPILNAAPKPAASDVKVLQSTPPRDPPKTGFFDSLKSKMSGSSDEAVRSKSFSAAGLVRIPLPARTFEASVHQSVTFEPLLYILPLESISVVSKSASGRAAVANVWGPAKSASQQFEPVAAHLKRYHPNSHRVVVISQQRGSDEQFGTARTEFDGTSLDGIMQICVAAQK